MLFNYMNEQQSGVSKLRWSLRTFLWRSLHKHRDTDCYETFFGYIWL